MKDDYMRQFPLEKQRAGGRTREEEARTASECIPAAIPITQWLCNKPGCL